MLADTADFSGIEGVEIGQTLTDVARPERMLGIAVEEPTISVDFIVNNGPFAGRDGKYVTSRQLRERLLRETEKNVALKVEETDSPDTHEGPGGELLEPYEELQIDIPEQYVGVVHEKLGPRRAELSDMKNPGSGTVRVSFRIPARGLFGYRSDFMTDTRGMGIIHHSFLEYGSWAGPITGRTRGVMVSMVMGEAVAFALFNLQDRGVLFVAPGEALYEGMIVGENARQGDLDVNPAKGKKLTNMRASGSDDAVLLEPPRAITLELALEYIEDDELIEVTPKAVRLRKRALGMQEREKLRRAEKRAAAE